MVNLSESEESEDDVDVVPEDTTEYSDEIEDPDNLPVTMEAHDRIRIASFVSKAYDEAKRMRDVADASLRQSELLNREFGRDAFRRWSGEHQLQLMQEHLVQQQVILDEMRREEIRIDKLAREQNLPVPERHPPYNNPHNSPFFYQK